VNKNFLKQRLNSVTSTRLFFKNLQRVDNFDLTKKS